MCQPCTEQPAADFSNQIRLNSWSQQDPLTTHGLPVRLHSDSETSRSVLDMKEAVDAKNLFRAIICQLQSMQEIQYSVESVV